MALVLASAASGYDNIRIEASLDDSSRTVTGVTTISFATRDSLAGEVHLRLWGKFRCQGFGLGPVSGECEMRIDSAFGNGVVIEPVFADDNVTDAILSLATVPQTESLTIVAYFTTVVPGGFDRLGYAKSTFFLDGWFPMPAPFREGRWMPPFFTQETELVGDFYNFEVLFRTSDSLQQIGSGLVSADTTDGTVTARYVLEPAHDFALAVGRGFKRAEYTEGQTRISVYHKTDSERIDSIAASVKHTMRYLSEHVGPYGYDELVILVGAPFSGGVEFPGMYWQGDADAGTVTRFGRMVAIHETTHQWFYGMIASSQADAPWMDEAVTEYFTAKIADAEFEGPSGIQAYGFTANVGAIDRLQGHPLLDVNPITWAAAAYDFQTYFGTIYGKGGMVINTFASLLGDFEQQFWQTYYERFSFQTPTDADFISLANEFPPYSQRRNAREVLEFNRRLDYRVGEISISRQTDTSLIASDIRYSLTNPLPFPVPMRLEFSSGKTLDTALTPLAGSHVLAITDSFPIVSAVIDPDGWYAVDQNYLNNSKTIESSGVGLRIFSGLTFLVESLFSWLWGI